MKSKKNIIKEVFIFIVLLILVLLILAVSLYDYIPSNIRVEEIKEYNADSKTTSIKQEIAYTNGGDSTADGYTQEELVTSLKSYSIGEADLAMYKQKNYDQGNSNPFEYGIEATNVNPNPDQNTNSNGNNNTTNTAGQPVASNTTNQSNTNTATVTQGTTNNSSTGTFFESPNSK